MYILTVFHLAIEISDSQLLVLLVHAVQANNLKTRHILSFRQDPVQTAFICTCTLSYVPLCGHIRYWQHHWSLVVSPSWDSPFHFKWLQERSVSSHWMQAWAMWFLHGNICLEVCRLDWNQGTPLCDIYCVTEIHLCSMLLTILVHTSNVYKRCNYRHRTCTGWGILCTLRAQILATVLH